MPSDVDVAIVGGGIAGLTFALALHERGIRSRVYEAAPRIQPLGVGISLLPHAMREFSALGLEKRLLEVGVENRAHAMFNRHGQRVYTELRGRFAGYPYPDVGIHRGRLHVALLEAAVRRIGEENILTDHRATGLAQTSDGVTVFFEQTSTGRRLEPCTSALAVACDGVNSAVRRQFYPGEKLAFGGINMWRGVTRRGPILDGRTYVRVGSIDTGKMVIYPIIDDVDGAGNQLINWVAELRRPSAGMNDWNKPGKLEDFFDVYRDWRFDWLDVPELISRADHILEYPMVDRDPVDRWTFGRVTLMGDAAHPMYPRGANGAAQAVIDARTLADLLGEMKDPLEALRAYEARRLGATARIVRTNREHPPDYIIMKVDELTGGEPFANIDDVIARDELERIAEDYARIAGFSKEAMVSGP